MKELHIEFNQEQGNYLQRLGLEVDSKVFLIDRMFANHANDTDFSLFDSIPFQHYHQEYEKIYHEYEMAKREFKEQYLEPEVQKILGITENIDFNWQIDDFTSGICKVKVNI